MSQAQSLVPTPPLENHDVNSSMNSGKLLPNKQMRMMNKARESASFDPHQLSLIIFGGPEKIQKRRAAFQRVENALDLTDTMKIPSTYLTTDREQQYIHGLKYGKALMDDEIAYRHGCFDTHTHEGALSIASPYGHNPLMFGPVLTLQSTAEQREKWMSLVDAGKIIGTYVQTELGHGTFVRGLETTATFDVATDEFIIHSPTVTSTKYWPSALGFSASHAIVMAKLMVQGKDYGPHPFIVQLRSTEDYTHLPGVETGDIGPKIGFNSTDMGYATFTNVRIPRDQMLMGHAKVLRDGTYVPPPHPKLAYTTLIWTRVRIIQGTSFQLAQAAVVATRFSVVREQGVGTGEYNGEEVAIVSYKSQQYRLLTIMSQAYALLFAGQACTAMYQAVVDAQSRGDHTDLPRAHALIASLKAYSTQVSVDGIEDARKCCGGFGFSDLSGFHALLGTVIAMPTLEGENYVMYQQTARYLVRGAVAAQRGESVDSTLSYLTQTHELPHESAKVEDFLDVSVHLTMFRHRAKQLVFQAAQLLQQAEKKEGLPKDQAWNKHMLPLVRAAHAHIELFVLESFSVAVAACAEPKTKVVLTHVRNLFGLTAIENPLFSGSMAFLETGAVTVPQLATIRRAVDTVLAAVLPEIIALGDAWDHSDASLISAIGVKDGNMYERIMAWTRQLPLNVKAKRDGGMHRAGYDYIIAPMLKSRL